MWASNRLAALRVWDPPKNNATATRRYHCLGLVRRGTTPTLRVARASGTRRPTTNASLTLAHDRSLPPNTHPVGSVAVTRPYRIVHRRRRRRRRRRSRAAVSLSSRSCVVHSRPTGRRRGRRRHHRCRRNDDNII